MLAQQFHSVKVQHFSQHATIQKLSTFRSNFSNHTMPFLFLLGQFYHAFLDFENRKDFNHL